MIEYRHRWLINLRWFAVAGIVFASLAGIYIYSIRIYYLAVFIVALLLLVSNFTYVRLYNKWKGDTDPAYQKRRALIIIQIVTDLILLTALLHFSGGVENPFIIYYVFHMMLASILLPRQTGFVLATFALFLVGLLAGLEYLGILPHYPLEGFINWSYYDNLKFLLGTGFVFITTSYVVVYMTGTVSSLLRNREEAYRKANVQLREKDKIKDEYVFRITHDIKGHLGAIKNCLDAGMYDLPEKEKMSFLERASKRTESTLEFIRELLRITQLRMHLGISISRIPVTELLGQIMDNYREQAQDANIRLEYDSKIDTIWADKVSLKEMMENLVSNGIKYTPTGGEVRIKVESEKNGDIIIQVSDTGIGIPHEDQEKVFNEFFRAGNNKLPEQQSSGIGLAIVRRIVENHKGMIILRSEPGQGSHFIIRLPDLSNEVKPS